MMSVPGTQASGFPLRLVSLGRVIVCASLLAAVLPVPDTAGAVVSPSPSTEPAVEVNPQPEPQRRRRRRRRRRGQRQPTAERIRVIQSALIREEYLKGEPTGRWDDSTRQAMMRFQKDNGFRVTGKPEALSLIKLGLGSETSGKGDPLPRPAPEKTEEKSPSKSGPDGSGR